MEEEPNSIFFSYTASIRLFLLRVPPLHYFTLYINHHFPVPVLFRPLEIEANLELDQNLKAEPKSEPKSKTRPRPTYKRSWVGGEKAETHCSDNENDNDANRTHFIGWIASHRKRPHSTNRGRPFLSFSFSFSLSRPVWPGLKRTIHDCLKTLPSISQNSSYLRTYDESQPCTVACTPKD